MRFKRQLARCDALAPGAGQQPARGQAGNKQSSWRSSDAGSTADGAGRSGARQDCGEGHRGVVGTRRDIEGPSQDIRAAPSVSAGTGQREQSWVGEAVDVASSAGSRQATAKEGQGAAGDQVPGWGQVRAKTKSGDYSVWQKFWPPSSFFLTSCSRAKSSKGDIDPPSKKPTRRPDPWADTGWQQLEHLNRGYPPAPDSQPIGKSLRLPSTCQTRQKPSNDVPLASQTEFSGESEHSRPRRAGEKTPCRPPWNTHEKSKSTSALKSQPARPSEDPLEA